MRVSILIFTQLNHSYLLRPVGHEVAIVVISKETAQLLEFNRLAVACTKNKLERLSWVKVSITTLMLFHTIFRLLAHLLSLSIFPKDSWYVSLVPEGV